MIFIETGAKTAEVMNLRWEHVDFNRGVITLPGEAGVLAKRSISVSKELTEHLLKKKPVSDFVFTNLEGTQLTRRQLTNVLMDFKRHYEIRGKWAYFDLRHSFARNVLARGGDLKALKTILGIRSLQTVEVVYGKHIARQLEISSPFES